MHKNSAVGEIEIHIAEQFIEKHKSPGMDQTNGNLTLEKRYIFLEQLHMKDLGLYNVALPFHFQFKEIR